MAHQSEGSEGVELEPLSTNRSWNDSNHKQTRRHTFKEPSEGSIEECRSSNAFVDETRSSYNDGKGRPRKRFPVVHSISRKHFVAAALLFTSIVISSVLIALASKSGIYTEMVLESSSEDCDLLIARGVEVVISQGLTSETPGVHKSVEQLSFAVDIRTAPVLSLTQAKAIDVMWNLFVGQGMRLIIGYIMYKTSCDLVAVYMKRSRIPYSLYISLCLDGPSISTTWVTLKSIFKTSISKSRLTISGLMLGMLYTVAFPTLVTTTSGYLIPTRLRYQMPDGILVPNVGNATNGCVQVHDGSRIGLQDNGFVVGPDYDVSGFFGEDLSGYPNYSDLLHYRDRPLNTSVSLDEWLQEKTNITFNGTFYALDAPPLNMSADWTIPINEEGSGNRIRRCYNGEILDYEWSPELVCIPYGNGYVWGFAKYFSISVLGIHMIWSMLAYFIWLYANLRLDAAEKEERLHGKIQSAGVLSNSLQRDLAPDFHEYTNAELEKALVGKKGVSFT